MSHNTNMAAFRDAYSMLHEMRALALSVQIIALTATSTKHIKEIIMDVLQMKNPYLVYESPGKPNITYSACYMPKDSCIDGYFSWLAKELKQLGISTIHTITYCQTIKQCTLVYSTLRGMLGNDLFTAQSCERGRVLLEILHSCICILHSFQKKTLTYVYLLQLLLSEWGSIVRGCTALFTLAHPKMWNHISRKLVGQAGMESKVLRLFYTMD